MPYAAVGHPGTLTSQAGYDGLSARWRGVGVAEETACAALAAGRTWLVVAKVTLSLSFSGSPGTGRQTKTLVLFQNMQRTGAR
jgi:hypothetical protein